MFTPTEEQNNLVEASKTERVLLVNAVSGGAKSSTCRLIAEANVEPTLYIVFNKSMQQEAQKMMPEHVECRTSHSLAYADVGCNYQHKLKRPVGRYVNVAGTGTEVAKFLKIEKLGIGTDKPLSENLIGLLVKKCVGRYEQSADAELTSKHLPKYDIECSLSRICKGMKDKQSAHIKKVVESAVLNGAKKLWKARKDENNVALITHDTYLKLWQLSKPVLRWKRILLDEAQDVSECMLDVIKNQADKKLVIVGDVRQTIYGWRGAVNAMTLVQGKTMPLSKSFRYGQELADVATKVLQGTQKIYGWEKLSTSVGLSGIVDRTQPYTILFRTNAALLNEALALKMQGENINIEVDVNDYIKLLESAQALYEGNSKGVKHEDIIPYDDWYELKEDSYFSNDMKRLVKAVEGKQVEKIKTFLKQHKNTLNPHIILSTAHKSKGLEYDQVVLANDFPSHYTEKGKWQGLEVPEQNLLYVACTRAKKAMEWNSTIEELYSGGGKQCKDHIERSNMVVNVNAIHNISDEYDLYKFKQGFHLKGEHAVDALNQAIQNYDEEYEDEYGVENKPLLDDEQFYEMGLMPDLDRMSLYWK